VLTKLRQDHPALSGGQVNLVETGSSGIYSVFLSSGSEKILVVVNLKDTPISDYQLSLDEDLLSDGVITPKTLFGTVGAAPLTISGGSFREYKPVNQVLPYQSYIFQLQ
jgi:glycosidase